MRGVRFGRKALRHENTRVIIIRSPGIRRRLISRFSSAHAPFAVFNRFFLPSRTALRAATFRATTLRATTLRATTLCVVFLAVCLGASTVRAATLRVAPALPSPGDVLTITIYPAPGERVTAASMTAFDTPEVKFYGRRDGSARAFVGLPFDRHGGDFPLQARVQIQRNRNPGGSTIGAANGVAIEEAVTEANADAVVSEQRLSTHVRARERYFPTQRISMNSSTAGTMSKKGALRQEKSRVQSAMKNSYAAPLWNGSWIVPTRGTQSSSYGRKRYVNGKWWGQHNGADVKAPGGASVLAANSGRVVLSQYLPTLRGNCIVVDHGCNVFSIYMHLSKSLVNVGQSVGKGQVIGRVGATGFVTGPHLHWEVRIGWEPVDPNHVVQLGLNF